MNGVSLSHLVLARADGQPDATAVIPIGGPPISWGELDSQARVWARALAGVGVGRGDLVLTMLPNGRHSVLGWVGSAYRGAIEVAVNHAFRGAWLEHVVVDTAAEVAIVHHRFWDQWAPVLAASALKTIVVVGCDETPWASSVVPRLLTLPEFLESGENGGGPHLGEMSETGAVIYTSGTTGASKGVMMPWRQWQHYAESSFIPRRFAGADLVTYAPTPPFHLSGKQSVFMAAYRAGTVCLRDGFKTDAWLGEIREHGCTVSWLIGAMAPFVRGTPEQPDDADNPLRAVVMAPIIPEVDAFKRRFGLEVLTGYSMTETHVPFCSGDTYRVTAENRLSCGKATSPADTRIIDEQGRPVPAGEIGELLLRGEPWELNAGYLNQPEASAAARRSGWFHTGDLFRYDEDGFYYFVDRAKDAIRRRGENISSFEVESAVNSHPAVVESAAFPVPSEFGEDEVMIAVVLEAGAELAPPALTEYLVPRMPKFALPRYIEYVAELPKTPTEKVRKAELRTRGVTAATWVATTP